MNQHLCGCIFILEVTLLILKVTFAADLFIPQVQPLTNDDFYILEYKPPHGNPASTTRFNSSSLKYPLRITNAYPTTVYDVNLTLWTKRDPTDMYSKEDSNYNLISGPDPPENISVIIQGRTIDVNWTAPSVGKYDTFLVTIEQEDGTHFDVNTTSNFYVIPNATGNVYNVSVATNFQNHVSASILKNIILGLVPPSNVHMVKEGSNETTIVIQWDRDNQNPVKFYNVTVFLENSIIINKMIPASNEPLQAKFENLIPGTFYNISVATFDGYNQSNPTFINVITEPLPPYNLTKISESVTSFSLKVMWMSPKSEVDGYIVSNSNNQDPKFVPVDSPREADIEDLTPGSMYTVSVRSQRGDAESKEVSVDVVTKPLPVLELKAELMTPSSVLVKWQSDPMSTQDKFEITYQILPDGKEETTTVFVNFFNISIRPDSSYRIAVTAISKNEKSNVSTVDLQPESKKILIEPAKNRSAIIIKLQNGAPDQEIVVQYRRLDTNEIKNVTGVGRIITLGDLYGGANYEINISTNKLDEFESYYQTTYPVAPDTLTIEQSSLTNNSMNVTWSHPQFSLVDSYNLNLSKTGFLITDIKENYKLLENLTPATEYQIHIYSVSNRVQGMLYGSIVQSTRPSPLEEVRFIPSNTSVTVEWRVPSENVTSCRVKYIGKTDKDNGIKNTDLIQPVTITDLISGMLYKFYIYANANNVDSIPVVQEIRLIPAMESRIITGKKTNDSINLLYTKSYRRVEFDKYLFEISDNSIPPIEKAYNDTDRNIIFTNLIPGKLYEILSSIISGNMSSSKISKKERTIPMPVKEIHIFEITATSAKVRWNAPFGEFDNYLIRHEERNMQQYVENTTMEYAVDYLEPFKNNTVTIVVFSGTNQTSCTLSSSKSQQFQTLEAAPGSVKDFQINNIKPYQVSLSWSEPEKKNGILLDYTLFYKSSSVDWKKISLPAIEHSLDIGNLTANTKYNFTIFAQTKAGEGFGKSFDANTPVWAPPPTSSIPSFVKRTTTTLVIEFNYDFFSNLHGFVTNYVIIVTEDTSNNNIYTWSKVQQFEHWPPYQTSDPFNPFTDGKRKYPYTIGVEDCTNMPVYCNGALKPGTNYAFKIRAFTDNDKFVDTQYSGKYSTDRDYTTVIIGVVVPVIVILILIIVLSVMRRRKVGPFVKKTKEAPQRSRDEKISITDSLSDKSRPVKIVEFPQHFLVMSADSDFRFSEEYEDLKHVGRDQPATAADFPVNRPKNRFTNILPYDHSRVKLLPSDDEEGSDYINSNYMPGYRSPREFIVTQGPLHSTRDDLWRMVWEQNCRAIVMLTRCVEKGREKCDHYWPYDMEPVYYGDLQVTIMNESQFPDWTITEFKVCLGDQARIVCHFHFTAWPDFGVPERPQTLIKFVRAFRERISKDTRPIVVHCSAGVGRSGTFIALDRLLQHIVENDYVDIFGIVYEMRKERVWMVQTEQQYICIHQCLLCVVEKKEDEPLLHPEAHENQGYDDDEGIAESGM